jgi:hypothetical protein
MPSLLQRLGMGLGQAAETLGKIGLERQREDRLAKLQAAAQQSNQAFSTSERMAGQEFDAGEKQKDRDARLAELKTSTAGKEKTGTWRLSTNDEGVKSLVNDLTGEVKDYDEETDSFKILGAGKPASTDETKAEDQSWGAKVASREASLFSSDATDFPIFKSEDKAAEAAAQFRSNARKAGKLDEFDTQYAKKGFEYINELAGQLNKSKGSTSTNSEMSQLDTAIQRGAKLNMSEEDVLNKLLANPNTKPFHEEIKKRLAALK